jgi:beta-1,4-N-acetylglucosaminyltransferase
MATSWKWTANSKLCFVTTGATAPFTALIEAVLSPSTLHALSENGFTHLLVQYGSAKDVYTKASETARSHVQRANEKQDLTIGGIDFNPDGLQAQFKLVQQSKGLVISHAGSGSILEALRYQIPLIVVPNTSLLDNHQEELAVAMERSNYLLRGHVEYVLPRVCHVS